MASVPRLDSNAHVGMGLSARGSLLVPAMDDVVPHARPVGGQQEGFVVIDFFAVGQFLLPARRAVGGRAVRAA